MIILTDAETEGLLRVMGRLGGSGWVVRLDNVMGRTGQKFLFHLGVSAIFAVATPAIAAGLMAGTSAAASANSETVGNAIYATDDEAGGGINSDSSPFIATHGPAKLSVLVGNDKAAWDSAHSVHVDFRHKPH